MLKSKLYLLIVLLMILLSSCLAGRMLVGVGGRSAGLAALRATSAGVGTQGGGLLRVASGAGLRRMGTAIEVTSPQAFYATLSEARLLRVSGRNPQIILKGTSTPIAEIFPNRGVIRIYETGDEFVIKRNIFSVTGNKVNIRSGTLKPNNRIIGKVYENDLVVVLGEKSGWYHVEIIKDASTIRGYVSSAYLIPIVFAINEDESLGLNYKLCTGCGGNGMIQNTIDCSYCNNGTFTCTNCQGFKTIDCKHCGGYGSWTCTDCDGLRENKCINCKGSGHFDCQKCDRNGYVFCNNCRGYGFRVQNGYYKVKCINCRGQGHFQCRKCFGNQTIKCGKCFGKGAKKCFKCFNTGKKKCFLCNATGRKRCLPCRGSGIVNCLNCSGSSIIKVKHECPSCFGYGKIEVVDK